MHAQSPAATSVLPDWMASAIGDRDTFATVDAQIELAIDLARRNVAAATGGPFGAAIFDGAGQLIAVGVNRVEPLRSSLAHAEIVALVLAQRRRGRPRLNADGRRYTLAASSQPCCQCYGAIAWAGVDTLLVGARASDTEALAGFDEGPLPANWIEAYAERGIRVVRDLRRDAACAVLQAYAASGGARY